MSTTSDMALAQKQQEHIVRTAAKLFGTYGVKTMTMEGIALSCGISKKTLYRLFENKNELLQVVIASIHLRLSEAFKRFRCADDAVMEVLQSLPVTLNIFRRINYRMLLDLEKFHYDIWRKVQAFRSEVIREFILLNLRRGQQEGLYRKDLDVEIIASMRLQQLIYLHSASSIAESDVPYALEQVTQHYLAGLVTERGRQRLSQSNK